MRRSMQHTVTMRHYIFNYCVRSMARDEANFGVNIGTKVAKGRCVLESGKKRGR